LGHNAVRGVVEEVVAPRDLRVPAARTRREVEDTLEPADQRHDLLHTHVFECGVEVPMEG